MTSVSVSRRFETTFTLPIGPAEAFPLFSPQGERDWAPGWDPELVFPPEGAWAQGQVFLTRDEDGEIIWVVTRLDREKREVEYYRTEPGRQVVHVAVKVFAVKGVTTVSVAYAYVGLSEEANAAIEAMTQPAYDAKIAEWPKLIRDHWVGRAQRGPLS